MLKLRNICIVGLVLLTGIIVGNIIPGTGPYSKTIQSVKYIEELNYYENDGYYATITDIGDKEKMELQIYIPSEAAQHGDNSEALEEYYIGKKILVTHDKNYGEILQWQVIH